MRRALCKILDGMAITIARQKIHRSITLMRAQTRIHQARVLDELRPIERGNGTHAGDDIADRPVIGDLVRVFPRHDFVKASVFFV